MGAQRPVRAAFALGAQSKLQVTDNPTLLTCEAEWLRDNVGIDNIRGQFLFGTMTTSGQRAQN